MVGGGWSKCAKNCVHDIPVPLAHFCCCFEIGLKMAVQRNVIPMMGLFPQPPKHLNAAGKRAWEIGRVLWADGTLKDRDLMNWTLFAEAVQEKEHCEKIVKKDGEYTFSPNGCFAQHPAIKRRQHAEDVIRRYSILFGLLPEARKKRPAVSQSVAQRPR